MAKFSENRVTHIPLYCNRFRYSETLLQYAGKHLNRGKSIERIKMHICIDQKLHLVKHSESSSQYTRKKAKKERVNFFAEMCSA